MKIGRVTYFNNKKGFGFLHHDDGNDYFFHITAFLDDKDKNIKRGDVFSFDVERMNDKLRAVNINRIVEGDK